MSHDRTPPSDGPAATTRRGLLAAAGCVAASTGLGGCLGSTGRTLGGAPEGTRATTTTPPWQGGREPVSFGLPSGSSGIAVHPRSILLQSGVHVRTGDGVAIRDRGDVRFLFVHGRVEAHRSVDDVGEDRFGVELADRTLEGWATGDAVDGDPFHPRFDRPYTGLPEGYGDERSTTGWVGFTVPPEAAVDDAVLRLDPTEEHRRTLRWRLPDGIDRAIDAGPPTLSLGTVEGRTTEDGDPGVSVTVENEGEVRGAAPVIVRPEGGDATTGVVEVAGDGTGTSTVPVSVDDRAVSVTVVTAAGRRTTSVDPT